jgi:hypothetical protein
MCKIKRVTDAANAAMRCDAVMPLHIEGEHWRLYMHLAATPHFADRCPKAILRSFRESVALSKRASSSHHVTIVFTLSA